MTNKSIYIPYFYIIKHLPSGLLYAGSKFSKNSNPEKLLKTGGYHTSSTVIKRIISEEGLKSFEIVLIKTEKECCDELGHYISVYDYETNFLTKNNIAKNSNWLNCHNNYGMQPYGSEEYKKSMLLHYGVTHNSHHPETVEKRKATCRENFGNDSYLNSEEYKKMMLEKYGVTNSFQMQSTKDQIVETNLERYGVKNYTQTQEYKEKALVTNLEKRGVEYASQSKEFRDKVDTTNLERYGVKCSLRAESSLIKAEDTLFKKYGKRVSNCSEIPEIVELRRLTQIAKRNRPLSVLIENYLKENNLTAKMVGISSHYLRGTDKLLQESLDHLRETGHNI